MLTEKFYCVNSAADHLLLDADEFIDGPLPILWHNNGLIGLISVEKVKNDLEHFHDLKQTELDKDIIGLVYAWDDTIRVKKLKGVN